MAAIDHFIVEYVESYAQHDSQPIGNESADSSPRLMKLTNNFRVWVFLGMTDMGQTMVHLPTSLFLSVHDRKGKSSNCAPR